MKYKVAFVCVGNSCRSQMAEGFARKYGSDLLEVYSAGTETADAVKPNAVKVMEEVGIDISDQYPKPLEDIPNELDILITMGCGVECPFIPCKMREDWGLEDPVGKPLEVFRETRDIIEGRVKELIEKVKKGDI
jgi:arsenate reductase